MPSDASPPAPSDQSIKPGRWPYLVAGTVVVTAAAVIVLVVQGFRTGFPTNAVRVTGPGTTEINLPQAGTYTISYERQVAGDVGGGIGVNSQPPSLPPQVSSLRLQLVSTESGNSVDIRPISAGFSYQIGSTEGVGIGEFDVGRPGDYSVATQYASGDSGPQTALAIAHGSPGQAFIYILGGFVALGLVLAAGAAAALTLFLRLRAKDRIQAAAPAYPSLEGQRSPPVSTGPVAGRPTGRRVVGVLAVLMMVAIAAAVLLPTLSSRTATSGSAARVVFDDDFSVDRGWDRNPADGLTIDLRSGHPGAMHVAITNETGWTTDSPGPSHARVVITELIANKTGSGDVGLICGDPGSDATYGFWAGSDGDASITFYSGTDTTPVSVLARAKVGQWSQGKTHSVTAVCLSDGVRASLELLVDGSAVLQATDSRIKGQFSAAPLAEGPVDFELRRFTVATV